MAPPTIDSKVMDNYISATNPEVASMGACYDENEDPMLFYVDQRDNNIHLIYHDPNTSQNHAPINLSEKLQLTDPATHVALVQSPDSYVTLALATTNVQSGMSTLLITKPSLPANIKSNLNNIWLQPAPGASSQIAALDKILMSPTTGLNDPTQIAVTTSANGAQSVVPITIDSTGWSGPSSVDYPGNPTAILDVSWSLVNDPDNGGNLPTLWILSADELNDLVQYELNGYSLIAVGDGTYTTETTQIQLPDNVTENTRLSVVANQGAAHDLLVLGAGLWHYPSSSFKPGASGASAQGNLLSPSAYFNGVTQATLRQNAGSIRLWFQSLAGSQGSGTMCYIKMNYDTLNTNSSARDDSQSLMVVPMIKAMQGDFVVLVASSTNPLHDQHFMYLDDNSNFNVATQSISRRWRTTTSHFSYPHPEKIIHLKTYTSNLSWTDSPTTTIPPLPSLPKTPPSPTTPVYPPGSHSLSVTAEDATSVYLNGIRYIIGPNTPAAMQVVPNGKLVIVHESSDLTVPILTIQESGQKPIVLDPTSDVQNTIAQINNYANLKAQTVPTIQGTTVPLVDPSTPDSQIQVAGNNLQGLQLQGTALKQTGLREKTVSQGNSDGIGDDFTELWHYLEREGENAIQWVQGEAKAMTQFIVQLADRAYTIAVNTIHEIVRVAKIVFNALKVAWDALKALVGAIFEWKTIMDTQAEIYGALQATLTYGTAVFNGCMTQMTSYVNTKLDTLQTDLDAVVQYLQDGDTGELMSNMGNKSAPSSTATAFATSSKGSLFTGAITHGGRAQNSFAVTPTTALQTLVNNITQTASTWFQSPQTQTNLQNMVQGLNNLLSSDPPTVNNIISLIQDLIGLIIDLVQLIIAELITIIESVADEVFSSLGSPISFPIISPLINHVWDLLGGNGQSPPTSILGIMSFVLAVIKVEYKDVFGKTVSLDFDSWFPDQQTVINGAVNAYGSGSPPPGQPQPLKGPKKDADGDDWDGYSTACAAFHPLALLASSVISPIINGLKAFEAMSGLSVGSPMLERIELFFSFVTLMFSCPGNSGDMKPGMLEEFIGYGIGGVTFVVKGCVALFFPEGAGEASANPWAQFAFGSGEAAVNVIRLSLYAASLHKQLNAPASQWQEGAKDKTDIQRSIGNLTCDFVVNHETWCAVALAPVLSDTLGPEVGVPGAMFGCLISLLAGLANYGVDQARGAAQLSSDRDTEAMGVYVGV